MSVADIILNRDPILETQQHAKLHRFASEQEWLDYRQSYRIGASESANLFGQGYSGTSTFKMYCEKLGLVEREPMQGKFLRIGKLMEPMLRKLFAEETGWPCYEVGEYAIHESIAYPFLVASLDGLVVTDDGVGVLELKNISYFNRDEWLEDCGPLKYQIQLQHQLAVTGLEFGYLFGLVGGQEPYAHKIRRNDDFIYKALIPACENFIRCLEEKTPPEIDASEATASVLKLLHPDDDGSTVYLDPKFVDLDLRLEEIKDQEKALSAEKKLIENEIKAALGSSTFGVIGNGYQYSLKTTARDGYYVEPSKFRALRRVKAK